MAAAQDVDPDEGLTAEIVVTAQKRVERLQDVPISISVQDGKMLEDLSIDQFIDLQSRVPNLSITDTPANASIFIRGIGTSGNTLSFEQSVALFVDQVYGGRNRQFMQPFFDVERVEVLRGPQGALFGRNTSAGAISVTTRRPSFNMEADLAADYEFERGSHAVQVGAGGPLTDDLAIRFATRYSNDRGWLDNIVLDRKEPVREDLLGRVSLLWRPEGAAVFAKVEYGDSQIIGAPFEFVRAGAEPNYMVDTDDGLAPLRDTSDSFNALIDVGIDVGDHLLTSITSYSAYDYGQAFNIQARRPARLVPQNFEDFEQFSQEVRISSPTGGAIDYIVGGYIEQSSSDIYRETLIDVPPPPALNQRTTRDFFQETDVLAVFGAVNWRPIDQLKLGLGLRWTRIDKEGSASGRIDNFPVRGPVFVVPRPSFNAEFSEEELSPTVDLVWQPNRDVTVYGRYAEGSKGGAFTESATTFREFLLEPEQAESYEVGAKLLFPAIDAFFNIAAFQADYTDLQKSSLDQDTATYITSNAAGARTRGVELDAGITPARGISILGALAYLDAFYTAYPNGPCRFDAGPACITQDRTGDRLQNSPEWTGNINLSVEQPLTDQLDYLLNWTITYQSDINFQDTLDPSHVQEAFTKTDLRLGLGANDESWELGFLVRNLFNERTSLLIFSTFPVGVSPLDRVHLPAPLRSYTLQGRVRF